MPTTCMITHLCQIQSHGVHRALVLFSAASELFLQCLHSGASHLQGHLRLFQRLVRQLQLLF